MAAQKLNDSTDFTNVTLIFSTISAFRYFAILPFRVLNTPIQTTINYTSYMTVYKYSQYHSKVISELPPSSQGSSPLKVSIQIKILWLKDVSFFFQVYFKCKCLVSSKTVSCVWFEGLLVSEVCRVKTSSTTGTQVSLTSISLKMFHSQICLLPIDLAIIWRTHHTLETSM